MTAYNTIIIGGGVCGMTAAIYAARAGLRTAILEKEVCGGLVNYTHLVENYPSYPAIHGMELMEKVRAHVEQLPVDIHEIDAVESVKLDGPVKLIHTGGGEEYQAGTVIIATGRTPRRLAVKTDFENVHYCSVCDGTAYKGKEILVIGGGNSGFDESLYLAGLGVARIHIIEAFPACIADAVTQERARRTGKITVSTSTELVAVEPLPDGRARVTLQGEKGPVSEETDGIFCFMGQVPNTEIFKDVLELENGYIKTDGNMETGIPGVFAAGDVIVKNFRQITTAMGDATIAALQAARYLRETGGTRHE